MAAIQRSFAQACARLISSNGWLSATRIDIEVNPYKGVDEEGVAGPTPPCLGGTTGFSFYVVSGDFARQISEAKQVPLSVPLVKH